ncbi:hypothetical protein D9611_001622 [Ephemerocybe angulata]|uniref:WD40 repeat-like protein n=1 Tax=Ephemerocybe angulata TaxID=980116 RepID=A0A8H5FMR5_9AGAR|nr:hypothetical protein D9611_001622 [Tulosesus angulatus]
MPPPPIAGPSSAHNLPIFSLNDTIIQKFKPAKVFKAAVDAGPPPTPTQRPSNQGPKQISGICFDDKGECVITAGEDETFRLPMKTLYSKKYGVDLPRFTHKSTAIVYASTKEDDTIRYHSLHDNKYLQYFKGHKGRVVSLEVSPVDDGFMSGSLDKTVRLWDLRSPTCRGLLALPTPGPLVAYDAGAMVFAVGVNAYQRIMVYDQANFDKAPFLTIKLDDPSLAKITYPPRPIFMTSLTFSSDGKYILVGCSGNAHYIVDGFDDMILAKLEGHIGLERRGLNAPPSIDPAKGISGEEVCFTPDNKYVLGGSLDGNIYVWDVQNLKEKLPPRHDPKSIPVIKPLNRLEGHKGPARCVRFNPRFGMLASAGNELAFWLPDMSGDNEDITKDLLRRKQPT